MKKSKQFLHICLHLLLEPTGLLHKKQTIDSYSRLWLDMSRSKTIQIILFPSKGIEVLYYIYTSLSVSKLKYIWIILCIEDVSFRWSESILAMEVLRQMCYIDQRSYKRSLANETHALKLLSVFEHFTVEFMYYPRLLFFWKNKVLHPDERLKCRLNL